MRIVKDISQGSHGDLQKENEDEKHRAGILLGSGLTKDEAD